VSGAPGRMCSKTRSRIGPGSGGDEAHADLGGGEAGMIVLIAGLVPPKSR